jgi:hypothetical protein
LPDRLFSTFDANLLRVGPSVHSHDTNLRRGRARNKPPSMRACRAPHRIVPRWRFGLTSELRRRCESMMPAGRIVSVPGGHRQSKIRANWSTTQDVIAGFSRFCCNR